MVLIRFYVPFNTAYVNKYTAYVNSYCPHLIYIVILQHDID